MKYLEDLRLKVGDKKLKVAGAVLFALICVLAGVGVAYGQVGVPMFGTLSPTATPVSATVDLTKVTQRLDPFAIGVGSSTYGANPLASKPQSDAEMRLDARYIRLPVGYRNNRVTSSAAGGPTTLDVPALVKLYRSWGYRVLIVIGGQTNDVDVQPGDATKIISALGTESGIDYSAPNEPSNLSKSVQDELALARMIVKEGKAINPNFKIWGPVWAFYSRGDIKTFAQGMGADLAGIDYHHYGMGSTSISTAQAMSETPSYAREITEIKADLASLGLNVPVNVDELNFSWRYQDGTPNGNNRFFTTINTVWLASSLGHILSAGGRGLPYATQNGPLGVMVEAGNINPDNRPASSPMPAYWGVAAWTGGKVWPHYNNAMYSSVDSDQNTEIYTVNNLNGGYNIIAINKDESNSKLVSLNIKGILDGTFTAYQTNSATPYEQPAVLGAGTYTTTDVNPFTLPKMSVTVIVLKPTSAATAPAPAPAPVPAPAPAPSPVPASALGTGLKAEYYNNKDFTAYAFTETDSTVDFDWGMGTPADSINPDTFSVRWSGQIRAEKSETYTFETISDDGVRLYVNGQLLINNWTDHSATSNSATIALTAGQKYDIRMEYYENGYAAMAKLFWRSPSTPRTIVPQGNLYPAVAVATPTQPPASNTYSNAKITGLAGKCITASNESSVGGTQMVIGECGSSTSQRFDFTSAGELRIRSAQNRCIDVDRSGTANGTKIQLWECNSTIAQKWSYTPAGELKGVGGKCLDLRSSNITPGNVVQLYECNKSTAQQWLFKQ